MTITDKDIDDRANNDRIYAELSIGENYYDLPTSGQCAIQRAKQNRVVWIDANGIIRTEQRKNR